MLSFVVEENTFNIHKFVKGNSNVFGYNVLNILILNSKIKKNLKQSKYLINKKFQVHTLLHWKEKTETKNVSYC